MRIFGVVVARNEADRYLDCCLSWHCGFLDDVHFYDDGSTDKTVQLALAHGCKVTQRALNGPLFAEHEGQTRQASWDAFEFAMAPEEGDWVLSFDADEFFVTEDDEADTIWKLASQAEQADFVGVKLPIREVFSVVYDGKYLSDPRVRVDGLWAQINGPRLFRYQPGGRFADRAMGCGSQPTYVDAGPFSHPRDAHLLHYGYADPADRKDKHSRYSSMEHGHVNEHIESILQEPTLLPWNGPHFNIWRGRHG